MPLEDYEKKRDFTKTSEPKGGEADEAGERFVVHEHHASRLHFDLRLEMDGVLKSWAIPKGPSMNPSEKHLAVMVEDHPLEYISFRGEIAEGNYGAGQVEIWDSGTYKVTEGALDQGKFDFEMFGTKLKGLFTLVRLKGSGKDWLLIKKRDEFADPDWKLEQVIQGGSRRDIKERQSKSPPDDKAPPDPMPRAISPMLATLVDKPFSDPEWLFELKWDGYRGISFIEKDTFKFVSRRNLDLKERFPQTKAIPGLIDAETAILDGEIVAVDTSGRPRFQLLQNPGRSLPQGAQLVYYVFDLLYLNGEDLRKRPLIERKELLKPIIKPNDFVKYSDHIIEKGEQLYEQAAKLGLEGIVAKRIYSPYSEKRSSQWLKMKILRQQEFVIGGYTKPRHSREYFGSLIVGVYEGSALIFAGQVGGGFDDATLNNIYDLMQPLKIDTCPFATPPKTNEPPTWIKPELVCEVKFTEWTNENILRQPVFLGMRPDRVPTEVIREAPLRIAESGEPRAESPETMVVHSKPSHKGKKVVSVHQLFEETNLKGDVCVDVGGIEVSLTNLDKVYWPEDGYTKGDLLRYYYEVRETILPHLLNRPLILKRYPNGINEEFFYQHNLEDAPDYVKRFPITEDGDIIYYAVIDSLASLLYIANLGCIAQNPFLSRIESLEHPDWILLDLDPEETDFNTVCEVAMTAKQVLDEVGLTGYPKTSGARGMHIYVPVEVIYTYQQTQDFGKVLATIVASRKPKIATIERLKKERTSAQVYVDYLQNAQGKTITSPYSVRPEPGATVSTPLTWQEVESKVDKQQFTMLTVPNRIAEIGDLFSETLTHRQKLTEPLKRLGQLFDAVK